MIDEKVNGKQEYRSGKKFQEEYLEAKKNVSFTRPQKSLMEVHKQKVAERKEEKTEGLSGLQKIVYEFRELVGRGESYKVEQKYQEITRVYEQAETDYANNRKALDMVREKLSEVQKEKTQVHTFLEASRGFYNTLLTRQDTLESELEAAESEGFDAALHDKRDDLMYVRDRVVDLYAEGAQADSKKEQLINQEYSLMKQEKQLVKKVISLSDQIAHAEIQINLYEIHKDASGSFNPHKTQDLYEMLGALSQEFSESIGDNEPGGFEPDDRFKPYHAEDVSKDAQTFSWSQLPKPK